MSPPSAHVRDPVLRLPRSTSASAPQTALLPRLNSPAPQAAQVWSVVASGVLLGWVLIPHTVQAVQASLFPSLYSPAPQAAQVRFVVASGVLLGSVPAPHTVQPEHAALLPGLYSPLPQSAQVRFVVASGVLLGSVPAPHTVQLEHAVLLPVLYSPLPQSAQVRLVVASGVLLAPPCPQCPWLPQRLVLRQSPRRQCQPTPEHRRTLQLHRSRCSLASRIRRLRFHQWPFRPRMAGRSCLRLRP